MRLGCDPEEVGVMVGLAMGLPDRRRSDGGSPIGREQHWWCRSIREGLWRRKRVGGAGVSICLQRAKIWVAIGVRRRQGFTRGKEEGGARPGQRLTEVYPAGSGSMVAGSMIEY